MDYALVMGLDRYSIWSSTTFRVVGILMVTLALTLLFPAIYAIACSEDASIFLLPIPFLLVIGIIMCIIFGPSSNFRTVHGLILVGFVWIEMFIIAALPFLLGGMSPLNAFFESVSCITTTGITMVEDVNDWPESLMVWRSMCQWIGGIAVVIIFIYILPMFGMGRMFFSNELEGSGSSQFSMKLRNAAKSFILVYLSLSIVNFVLLLLVQASFVDALCLSLTTISTGGLLVSNTSLMDSSIWIQVITMIFMFIGGVNFYLHYKALYGRKPRVYLENSELKFFALWLIVMSIVVYFINIWPMFEAGTLSIDDSIMEYKNSLFTVISFGTTSGFVAFDHSLYPEITMFVLIMIMLIGGSAGSTSGGIKFGRIRVLIRFFHNSLKNVLHPNAVYTVKIEGENIDDRRVISAVSVTLLYVLTTLAAIVVLLACGMSWIDSFGVAVGTITNTGTGFGDYGPTGTFAHLSAPIKLFLMLLMWMGRLEITLALVFLTPAFWRDVRFSLRASRKGMRIKKD